MATRIAIVGLGKIARDQHVPVLQGNAGFDLVATVDPRESLAGIDHYPQLNELLEVGPEVDAVAICTPPQTRAALARRALRHGCHVLLEKPPAVTPAEGRALVGLAQQQRVALFATWHSRFAAGVEATREWLRSRHAYEIRARWKEDVRVWHPGQRWIWEPGGFGVFDPGLNALSILTHLVPGPFSLSNALLVVPVNRKMPIAATMNIETPQTERMIVELDFLYLGTQHWTIQIQTDRGNLELSEGGAVMRVDTQPATGGGGIRFEYEAIYRRFAELIVARQTEVDLVPLELAAEALDRGQRQEAEPYLD